MTLRHFATRTFRLVLLLAAVSAPLHAQCVSLTTLGSASSQNFDTLSNTAGSTTNNLTITGWFLTESGGGARDNEQYGVDTGASNTGDTYSYGAAAATDRAIGGLQSGTLIPIVGACFTNNSGSTITSLQIDYTGEEWRLGTVARTDQINFEYSTSATDLVTGTWTGVAALNFVTPFTATTGARDGNAAANRTALTSTIPALSIANGATFWIRWTDTNASGADDGLAVDDFSLTPNPGGGPVTPNLSINDVALAEGNAGTTTFQFTVSLSSPAGVGGVTFDIATADNTATTANNDYVSNSLTGQTIPSGSSTSSFNVTVNGDTTPEANETFFVNVTNVVGATVIDGQGTGTLNNDDVTLTPIHDIQGPGASSPIVGASVTTRGIVTGVKSNGFFLQEPDASVDADPATSEGVFVFTSSAPPATAVVGAQVQVTATVVEFVPSADALQPPLTELSSPTVVQLSTGNPLPAAIPLTSTFPDPIGVHDQLERLEGMRVSVASLTVVAPTQGNVNEANATSTSNGVFYGVVTGVARPFREAGIQAPDPAPAGGSIPPIPRFDSNPERIRVDSDALTGAAVVNVGTGAVITGLIGPLDYTFRTYTILPDSGATLGVTGGPTATAVTAPTSLEFTVASFNLQRFFDTVNDPAIGEPVLTATAFDNRLNKASLAIRNFLRMPDILGVIEVENLTTLQALANRIGVDALAASQPDPQYVAYLVEGNDVGGIDVGFLVKNAPASLANHHVTVTEVVQELDGTLFVNPDSSTETLNDRPTLRLTGTVDHVNGATFPVTVMVNHLRSLNGVNDESAGSNGWTTVGARVRAKRLAQAVDLAGLIQSRQTTAPTERIVVIGDFNAFEVNDGLADMMDVILGTPVPDNQTAVPGDGVDLVTPDLINLFSTPPAAERYSYSFDGNAQSIDHILINGQAASSVAAYREEHPRLDADFPETDRNNAASATRLSDHDPVVAYFQVAGFASADLGVTKTDSPDPVTAGANLTYTVTVQNLGPDTATSAAWSDTLPAGTTFVSLASAAGWSCTTPAVGSGGTVTCTRASFGLASDVFTLVVAVDPGVAAGTVLSNTAAATSTTADPQAANNSATATTTVAGFADLSLTKTDAPDPVDAGQNLVYTITVSNEGPSSAATVAMTDPLPANTTFVSLGVPGGWSCTTPAVGAAGTVSCSIGSFPAGSAVFTLTVQVSAGAVSGSLLTNVATVSSATPDPHVGSESDTSVTTVGVGAPELALVLADTTDPVTIGQSLTYTIDVTNALPSATTPTLTFPLPAGLGFTSLVAPGGWSCTTPAVGAGGTISCSAASLGVGLTTFQVTTQVATSWAAGATINATASLAVDDSGRPVVATDDEATGVRAPASLAATKSVAGDFTAGGFITYTLVVTNAGPGALLDLPGDELSDTLPASLDLVSASADAGTAVAVTASNLVTWNGTIPAGGSVTVTITARILASTGASISNQATIAWDGDGDGASNEATGVSDDPGTAAGGDPTSFTVATAQSVIEIPTLDAAGLALLALLLALAGAVALRRRPA